MDTDGEEVVSDLTRPVTIVLSLEDRQRLERIRRYLMDTREDCPILKGGDVLRWCIKAVDEILVKEGVGHGAEK